MRHNLKIVIAILILLAVLFFLLKFFDVSPAYQPVIDPSLQKSYSAYANGDPIGTALPPEPGRVRVNSFPSLPPGFPDGLPIDPNPIRVVQSYKETMDGDQKEGVLSHTQLTYIYVTGQSAVSVSGAFEKYFKDLDLDVSKKNEGSVYTVYGETKDSSLSININISSENQFERLVAISILSIEK
ncbi:MAG: hypothetical protein Q8Q92_01010, partial [bacterium]|nr:hypothetical protein [bacterium]